MRRLRHYAEYLAVRFLICFVQALPLEFWTKASRTLGWVLYDVVKLRRGVIEENLQFAFPDATTAQRDAIGRDTYSHLLLMVCEIAHAPRKIHETNWKQHFVVRDKPAMVRLLLDPRPVVLVSAHYGNFELGGYMLGMLGLPTFTVARTLDNPYLDAFVNRFREAKGQFIVDKSGSAGQIDEVLARGGKLLLLGDQHAGPKGCWVEFFGRPASCHKAIAVFPLSAGAPLAVAYNRRRLGKEPLQFEMGLHSHLDPRQGNAVLTGVKPVTQWYNQQLEQLIREYPSQYWWVHRRWRDAPAKAKKSATESVARAA
jgi:KDO2-lipid IV(A) lauroyltransferase